MHDAARASPRSRRASILQSDNFHRPRGPVASFCPSANPPQWMCCMYYVSATSDERRASPPLLKGPLIRAVLLCTLFLQRFFVPLRLRCNWTPPLLRGDERRARVHNSSCRAMQLDGSGLSVRAIARWRPLVLQDLYVAV